MAPHSLRCPARCSAATAQRAQRSSRTAVCVHAVAGQQQQPQRQERRQQDVHQPSLASRIAGAGLAVTLAATALLGPVQPALAAGSFSTLADVMREDFGFVDKNNDGIIDKTEIVTVSKEVAEEEDFVVPDDDQIEFTMRLFDLNQDGKLTTDEMLTTLGLDSGAGEGLVDQDVYAVYDSNNDGFVDLSEFKRPFGDFGPNGEALKEFVFRRVDHLVNDDKRLDTAEFVNAFQLVRVSVLGY